MSSAPSTPSRPRPSLPLRRTFGAGDSALDDTDAPSAERPQNAARRILGGFSFGQNQHRPSFAARWRGGAHDEEAAADTTPNAERPPIPSALQTAGEAYTTPLPVLSMIVLSIVRRIAYT
jgi:hypothetical protein